MMVGTHRDTGERLEGLPDVEQSVSEILRTPLRTRPCRPDFGADQLGAVDQPFNSSGKARIASLTADAVARWERRIRVSRVVMDANAQGEVDIILEGRVSEQPARATVSAAPVGLSRRLLGPAGYCDRSSFAPGSSAWSSRSGPRGFGPVPAWLDIEEPPAPTVVAEEGVRFEAPMALAHVETERLAHVPGSFFRPWTMALAWRPDAAIEQIAWSAGPVALPGVFGPDGYALPWLRVGMTSAGEPEIQIDHPSGSGTFQALLRAPDPSGLVLTWVWHIPWSPTRQARIGWEGPGGIVETEWGDPMFDAELWESAVAAHLVTLGGTWDGDVFDSGAAFTAHASHVGMWPRVLTRRERLSIDALWRRELEL